MVNEKGFARYEKEALRRLQAGWITDIQFSNATYLIEITDPQSKEKAYTFFQFDESGTLKDAFCSCEKENCLHLAVAFLKIFGEKREPLHLRFQHSLWFALTRLFAEEMGFDPKLFSKKREGDYLLENKLSFHLFAKSASSRDKLKQIFEKRRKETPDNSIKFSNLNQEEIDRWREGRPSFRLRYELSFWSDLAKWLFLQQEEKIDFNEEGLPSRFTVSFKDLELIFTLPAEYLALIVAYFTTVHFPLKIDVKGKVIIEKITYDPQLIRFHVFHSVIERFDESKEQIAFDGWVYVKGVGFYRETKRSPFLKEYIEKEEIEGVLTHFGNVMREYLSSDSIHAEEVPLQYELFFDEASNLHVKAYLFEKGDLDQTGSAFFKSWVYLPSKGFFALKNPLFPSKEMIAEKDEVGRFITEHRAFFSEQKGFNLHVSGIETTLSFDVTKEGNLRFFPAFETPEMKDFGEYLYFQNLGFFSKKETRLASLLRPGTEIARERVPEFLRQFREDLENIPHFFCPKLPVEKRGLTLAYRHKSVVVRPEIKLIAEFAKVPTILYTDAIYLRGIGFYDLSDMLRLPDKYQKEVTIPKTQLASFFYEELLTLEPLILSVAPELTSPSFVQLELTSLQREKGGLFSTSIAMNTDIGSTLALDLHRSLTQKKRFHFSSAGRFDLKEERLEWLHRVKGIDSNENLLLTTLDFIKLDATSGFVVKKNKPEVLALLEELREFKTRIKPNLIGLKSELRSYQQKGLEWLWFLCQNGLSGLLCDEMGLGKTHQAMALMQAMYNEEKGLFLIVAPTSVIYHWEEKLARFLPEIPVTFFHGLERSKKQFPKSGILLTSYGIARIEKKRLSEIKFSLAIYDEIQIAKNPKSQVHGALAKIDAPFRLGLTGTPIENNLQELKSLFDLILPTFLPSEERFKELFLIPIEKQQDEKQKKLLTTLVKPFILRRKKKEVLSELPEKTEDKFLCDLSDEQKILYQKMILEGRTDVKELLNTNVAIPYLHIFALLSKLKQISDHPALFLKDPNNYRHHQSGKWELFLELLSEALSSEQKVVVFSQYLYMLDIITAYLREQKIEYAEIRGDTINRKEEMRRFQEDDNCRLFVGSLQAAGLGIDLTAASTVILYDRWWNAARENQAIDRVHRIGQKWAVQVYKLISKGTIDEKIDAIISRKAHLMEEIVPVDDETQIKTLTREELIEILSYTS